MNKSKAVNRLALLNGDACRPEIADQRAMLTQAFEQMRQQGFQCEIELTVIAAQNGKAGDTIPVQQPDGSMRPIPVAQRKHDLKTRMTNCYNAARALQQQIEALGPVESSEDAD